MKKLFFAIPLFAAAMTSCNNDVESISQSQNPEVSPLVVNAYVEGDNASRASWNGDKKEFKDNDMIGLYVYKTNWGTTYNNTPANVKSTFNAGKWLQSPEVNMTADKAQIWAYYPYIASSASVNGAGDGKKISVDLTKDWMYGTNGGFNVSTANPNVNIVMKHALTQFVLRLKKSPEYKEQGILTNIQLEHAQAKFAKNGTMDVTTGTITGTDAKTNIAYTNEAVHFPSTDTTVDYAATLFPMNTEGVTLRVVIDRVEYTYKIPTANWEKGKKNVYSVQLKSNSIVIGGEDGKGITIEPWGTGTHADVELTPVQK